MTEIVQELTNGEFESFTKEGVVLIDFFAEWCMPCMMMAPIIEDLNEEFEGKAKIAKLNIDDSPELADKYNVSSIPTFIIFKEGKVVEQLTGSMIQDELSEALQKHLN
ncbi:thioredoxin [archaeon]|nr:thioredoxin [archaeon]